MIILHHARIHTLNPDQPVVSALAIAQGRIVYAGSDDEVLAGAPAGAQTFHMEGKTILPGLADAHIHFSYYALSLSKIYLDTPSRSACLRLVSEHARNLVPGEWLLGYGWESAAWEEGPGNADILEQAAPGVPVFLTSRSLHSGWANRTALRLAGITAQTPDPPGGLIGRDSSGEPDGFLYEKAKRLIDGMLPQPSQKTLQKAMLRAQTSLWQMGITTIHDFDKNDSFIALQEMELRGELKLRVIKSILFSELDHAVGVGLRSGFGSHRLRMGSVKLFADGALGPRTAAMLEPFEDAHGESGMLLLDADAIFDYGRKAVSNGLSIAVHALGDRANHETLNAFARLRAFEQEQGLPPYRHRLEHGELLIPADRPRIGKMGIIASLQPMQMPSDRALIQLATGKREKFAFPLWDILRNGAILALGSDAPVESPNPFWGIHAAVTRSRQGDPDPAGVWMAEQRISLQAALEGYTTGPAFAGWMENQLGKLAPGYLADLIVLDQDIFDIPPQEIYRLQPSAVMFDGKWVWQR